MPELEQAPSIQGSPEASVLGLVVGTPQHFVWLSAIVKCVLVMNLIDGILTLLWVRSGLAVEANTLIDELVNEHAMVFICVKLALVGMGSWLLWNRRGSPLAVVGIFAAFVTYYSILLLHIQYASGLFAIFIGP